MQKKFGLTISFFYPGLTCIGAAMIFKINLAHLFGQFVSNWGYGIKKTLWAVHFCFRQALQIFIASQSFNHVFSRTTTPITVAIKNHRMICVGMIAKTF